MKIIINALEFKGYHPRIVYNSNGYDDVDQLKNLEGRVDVYLPDFKYMDADISRKYSDAGNYPVIALAAHKEMLRQMGSNLLIDNEGYAMRGMLVRHLVLPGNTENSLRVVETIAEQLSVKLSISLMSQYYPSHHADDYPALSNTIDAREYFKVVDRMSELGFTNGYIQEIDSASNYRPDFNVQHPFER